MRDIINLRQLQAMSADDAAALLAARLSDQTGPHDVDLLDDWLAEEDAHRLAWDRTQRALFIVDQAQDDDVFAELRQVAREAGRGTQLLAKEGGRRCNRGGSPGWNFHDVEPV